MKNILISMLSAIIVSGFDLWIYTRTTDRLWVFLGATICFLFMLIGIDEFIYQQKMKRLRAKYFGEIVKKLTEQKGEAQNEEKNNSGTH